MYKVEGNRLIFDNPYFRKQIHLMQFTGLKDKNGKEIYEGDILRSLVGYIFMVTYDEGSFCIQSNKYHPLPETLFPLRLNGTKYDEVIGNIYENAEMFNNVERYK